MDQNRKHRYTNVGIFTIYRRENEAGQKNDKRMSKNDRKKTKYICGWAINVNKRCLDTVIFSLLLHTREHDWAYFDRIGVRNGRYDFLLIDVKWPRNYMIFPSNGISVNQSTMKRIDTFFIIDMVLFLLVIGRLRNSIGNKNKLFAAQKNRIQAWINEKKFLTSKNGRNAGIGRIKKLSAFRFLKKCTYFPFFSPEISARK